MKFLGFKTPRIFFDTDDVVNIIDSYAKFFDKKVLSDDSKLYKKFARDFMKLMDMDPSLHKFLGINREKIHSVEEMMLQLFPDRKPEKSGHSGATASGPNVKDVKFSRDEIKIMKRKAEKLLGKDFFEKHGVTIEEILEDPKGSSKILAREAKKADFIDKIKIQKLLEYLEDPNWQVILKEKLLK
jgi:hypothetical protein